MTESLVSVILEMPHPEGGGLLLQAPGPRRQMKMSAQFCREPAPTRVLGASPAPRPWNRQVSYPAAFPLGTCLSHVNRIWGRPWPCPRANPRGKVRAGTATAHTAPRSARPGSWPRPAPRHQAPLPDHVRWAPARQGRYCRLFLCRVSRPTTTVPVFWDGPRFT